MIHPLMLPDLIRTLVTGVVENSKFHHNFTGIQVIQAGDMTFTNNEFYSNDSYGFLCPRCQP